MRVAEREREKGQPCKKQERRHVRQTASSRPGNRRRQRRKNKMPAYRTSDHRSRDHQNEQQPARDEQHEAAVVAVPELEVGHAELLPFGESSTGKRTDFAHVRLLRPTLRPRAAIRTPSDGDTVSATLARTGACRSPPWPG